MNARKARRAAIRILEEFEELLDERNVTVASNDREGREEEARLCGSEYYGLEDAITEILFEETMGRKMGAPGLLDG